MPRYLALLGSINVGGNRIKMIDLKAALEGAGFEDVATVAASGNVIFADERDPAMLEIRLESVVQQSFGFTSCAMVRSAEEVRYAIEENPFHGTGPEHGSDKMVHSIFLSQQPDTTAVDALIEEHRAKGSERLALGDRVLFLGYVHGVGVSDLSNKTLERRLKVKGTARNMTSLKRILGKMVA
ncbi:DUF1697 domain-containing protein [Erythrobacter litoralis]|uniref:DUF1697 domain-containing protein n=1 Tax=Erythrobacter litoralis (strain HTCC2594) TaxID=314225 RepID=Q2NC07_ERYLH|nr:DUF1697 domain-containing protein [Erythrobacter litoralis]ABC62784.1 hypothetical protein ELI_03460 [Erythrobacter litoralis HTCC2594]